MKKRLEIRLYIDIDEDCTDMGDIRDTLEDDLEQLGDVVRVDLIDEFPL